MNQLNQLILEGNVAKVPEACGQSACTMSVASKREYRKVDGERVVEIAYFDVDCYGKLAELCVKYATQGRRVRIVGRLIQERWVDTNHMDCSRVKVLAEHIDFLKPSKEAEA